ncbi:MAG: hypothetical protein M0006_13575 [Magnetospirillum sp.]|nr:hypothetical protein [Magnetospirillum sp.]
MGHIALPHIDRLAARRLAYSLEEVAQRLGRAASVAEFISALEENRSTWRKIRCAAKRYGWALPRRFMDFCLASSEPMGRCCVSDHDVEAIISINLSVSKTILMLGKYVH